MVAVVVLVINLVLTIWAVSTSGVQDGLGTLQDGSCKRTATLTFWMHLAINVLSTLLLGASNYSMQCLSSPTRSEIDKAHAQGIWLDIGVPSVRNLRRLSTSRVVLWWLLAISSIPLHLLYNSAVFSSLCTRRYNIFVVSSDFFDGASFYNLGLAENMTEPEYLLSSMMETLGDYQENQTAMVKLEDKACLEIYTAPIVSTNSDVVLVSTSSDPNNSLLYFDLDQDSQLVIGSYHCSLPFLPRCDPSDVIAYGQNWTIQFAQSSEPRTGNYIDAGIQYCLSKQVEEHCKIQFSLPIMISVIICNLIKTICMSIVVWKQDPEPLVTLGDALASFLDWPDLTTEGNCIGGKNRFEDRRSWRLLLSNWDPKPLRWFRAASLRRWLVCNIL